MLTKVLIVRAKFLLIQGPYDFFDLIMVRFHVVGIDTEGAAQPYEVCRI